MDSLNDMVKNFGFSAYHAKTHLSIVCSIKFTDFNFLIMSVRNPNMNEQDIQDQRPVVRGLTKTKNPGHPA